jgi:hypothetical protein
VKKKRRLLQSDTFWGLTAAFLVVLQFWWLPGEDGSAADSYSTTVDGKLGLYRVLSQLYPRVERDALLAVPEERSCLVLISPDRYPNEKEQTELYHFVDNGGTLVFAPNWDDPEFEMLSLGIHTEKRLWSVTTTATPTATTPATQVTPAAGDPDDLPAEAAETQMPPASIPQPAAPSTGKSAAELEMDAIPPNGSQSPTPSGSTADTAATDSDDKNKISSPEEMLKKKTPGLTPAPGIETSPEDLEAFTTPGETVDASSDLVEGSLEWHSSADLEVPSYLATETLVSSTEDRIEAATWPMGNGRVIACSSSDIFSNRSMLYRNSRLLAVRLVERGYLHGREKFSQDTPIVLSEFFNASDAYAQTGVLFSPSLRIGTLQLVLVAVLGIWLAFYRFGPAEDVSTLQRRSLTESAQAVGNLQYRLNDGGAVIRSYLEYIRSQLRRRYGSMARLDQPETLASRAGMNVDEVRTRLAEAHALADTAGLPREKTASSLRWLAEFQRRLSGIREEKAT